MKKDLTQSPLFRIFCSTLIITRNTKPMSILSRHFEYAIPAGRTFSLVRDRGIEYSPSGHKKVRLLDQMKLALRSRHYSRRTEETKLGRCEELLGSIEDQKGQATQSATREELLFELTGIDPRICPCCKKGRMIRKEELRPVNHAPP